jgi:hypothetical protein
MRNRARMTTVPIVQHVSAVANGQVVGGDYPQGVFSTGSDSPVSYGFCTRRLADSNRRESADGTAGFHLIISPAPVHWRSLPLDGRYA